MSVQSNELARFQALLLRILYDKDEHKDLKNALLTDPDAEPYKEWILRMDPAMLEIAAVLAKKWAVLKSPIDKKPL